MATLNGASAVNLLLLVHLLRNAIRAMLILYIITTRYRAQPGLQNWPRSAEGPFISFLPVNSTCSACSIIFYSFVCFALKVMWLFFRRVNSSLTKISSVPSLKLPADTRSLLETVVNLCFITHCEQWLFYPRLFTLCWHVVSTFAHALLYVDMLFNSSLVCRYGILKSFVVYMENWFICCRSELNCARFCLLFNSFSSAGLSYEFVSLLTFMLSKL